MSWEQTWVDANGVRLSVLESGPIDRPPVVLLHGMRDVADSLLPIADRLTPRYRVLLPELRGHGRSDQPGCYTFEHYLFDLHALWQARGLRQAHVIGHSLGGQILVRLASVFPEWVSTAIVVEGLGPPDRPEDQATDGWLTSYGQHLLAALGAPTRQRPLPDLDFAISRLIANNPRLKPQEAARIAQAATTRQPDGTLTWAFDPRIGMTFTARTRRADNEPFWRNVRCPTLIVSGDLAHEYWRAQFPTDWDGRFADGELKARVNLFAQHEHVSLPQAGHMVHYDQPEALATAVLDFLERHS
jgi:pimeloyl-ACP methyl ester carboxylesterase